MPATGFGFSEIHDLIQDFTYGENLMIKDENDIIWERLIKGELNVKINLVPAQLLLSRCQRQLGKDDSPETMKKLKSEVHTFFIKFQSILEDEIKQLFG